MTEPTRQNMAETRRGRPFPKGHSGRPRGTRNKARLALETLLEGEGEALTRKAVAMALSGDTTALRLCLDRLLPARKDRPVAFALPPLATAADAVAATAALVEAVASGELTPMEAGELSKLVDSFARAVELREIEARLAALEQARDEKGVRR